MFDGFRAEYLDVGRVRLRVRHGGSGPTVLLVHWYHLDPTLKGAENHADVARAVANPAVQHAMCEDYRAGLGVDRAADDADRNAGRKITSPLLVLWGIRDDLADLYDNDVLRVWGPWATDLSGHGRESAHHIAEEAPQELTHALLTFFRHTVR